MVTPFISKKIYGGGLGDGSDEKKMFPLGKKFVEKENVAETILFLASDEASFITGEIIQNDNGYSINHSMSFTNDNFVNFCSLQSPTPAPLTLSDKPSPFPFFPVLYLKNFLFNGSLSCSSFHLSMQICCLCLSLSLHVLFT